MYCLKQTHNLREDKGVRKQGTNMEGIQDSIACCVNILADWGAWSSQPGFLYLGPGQKR